MVTTNHATATSHPTVDTGIGGKVCEYVWQYSGQQLRVVYETCGAGKPVLLLPAFSTVSTRTEMKGIAQQLTSQYQAVAVDWPGFGDSERPFLDYQAPLYLQFLQDFVRDIFDSPIAVVAAGHAAGYVMQLAQKLPSVWSHIVLVAPTWRGPLPTMGANPQVASIVREMVRSPLVGQFLYKLNTNPSFLRLMYRRHVYTDAAKLTPEFMERKYQITQQPGARFAPAAFVTGAIDPLHSRDEFLSLFESLSVPIMVIIPEQAPPSSTAEMEALGKLPEVEIRHLPGSLGLHEENSTQVSELIFSFINKC